MTALEQFTYDQLISAVEKLWPNVIDAENFLENITPAQAQVILQHLTSTTILCNFSVN